MFLGVQFLALCFSPCILSLWVPLLIHTLSYTIYLLTTTDICTSYEISEILHSMQSCRSDVKAWATAYMFKLIDNKTELMLVTSMRTKHLHSLPTLITIGNAQIPFTQYVKNLGFTLDCQLAMNAHVSNRPRTCYFELRRLESICRFLTSTASATFVSALVL